MKSKKIISGLLALTFVFGGAVLPNAAVGNVVVTANAESLTYGDYNYTILKDDTVSITGYHGKDTKVEIPGEIEGKTVTAIGYAAFHYNKSIVSVSMPDSITKMDRDVFADCVNLVEVKLSSNLTTIGSWSFYNTNKSLLIKCYNGSYGETYALRNGINFKVLDVEDKTEFPVLSEGQFNSTYHQFRLKWTEVEGAEEYAIAVKLNDKWRVQKQGIPADTTTYTTPKNIARGGKTFEVAIAAKIDGKWDTDNAIKNAFKIYVK